MQCKVGRREGGWGSLVEERWGCDRGDYREKDDREVNSEASAPLWKLLVARAFEGRKRTHTSEHVSCTWFCVGYLYTAID